METLANALPASLMPFLTASSAYVALQWIIRVAAIIIVPFRRTPSAAKAWLLLILFQPIIGLILYIVFGRAIQPRWLQQRRTRWTDMFASIIKTINTITEKRGLNLKKPLPLQTTYLQKQFPLPPSSGNHAELIDVYDDFNIRLMEDIAQAKHHIHLLFYIFRNDATGHRIANALADAAARGVTCRVLIDAIGSWPRTIRHRLRKSGVQVHAAVPLSRKGFLTRADLRNHRKIAVIDGKVAYTGSQNITNPSRRHQRELMVRLQGPCVLGLQAIFSADWFLESEEVLDSPDYYPTLPVKPYGPVVGQVLPSGPDYPGASVDDLVITLIHNARSHVTVATPYFIPSEPLLQALKSATKRGVRVSLITTRKTDSRLVRLAQSSYYEELLKAGVHIHIYKSGFFHAKYMTIDGLATLIGSSNIDLRSFELNGEINLMLYGKPLANSLTRLQTGYLDSSQPLNLQTWRNRPLPLKLAENLARLLSPLL